VRCVIVHGACKQRCRGLTSGANASMRLLSAMVSVALLTSLRFADDSACLHGISGLKL
jgi:hypothetical protein